MIVFVADFVVLGLVDPMGGGCMPQPWQGIQFLDG